MNRLRELKEKIFPGAKKKEGEAGEVDRREWHLIIDVALCEDCNNCFLACKDEHVDNEFTRYAAAQPRHGHRWMNIGRRERGRYPVIDVAYLPTPCQHCREAPCLRAAKDGAVYRREDGIVIIDPERAVGRKALVDACPYGAVFWNEEKNLPQKCTFCAHLLDSGWENPRCVQACPTGAMRAVRTEPERMERVVETEGLETLKPEYGTAPRVYYKNLSRFEKCFIAGSAAYEKDGAMECAQGARVSITGPSGQAKAVLMTDAFGDFKYDGLDPDGDRYTVEIEFEGREKKRVEVELTESVFTGVVIL